MREIRRSVMKAVERHSIMIVTVKTLGPRFCIESSIAVAMLDSRPDEIAYSMPEWDQVGSKVEQQVVVVILGVFHSLLLLLANIANPMRCRLLCLKRRQRRGGGGGGDPEMAVNGVEEGKLCCAVLLDNQTNSPTEARRSGSGKGGWVGKSLSLGPAIS